MSLSKDITSKELTYKKDIKHAVNLNRRFEKMCGQIIDAIDYSCPIFR